MSAGYQGISIDNVGDQNAFDEEGVCSVSVPAGNCASNGGVWTPLPFCRRYGDGVFVAKRLAWLNELTRVAHAHNAATTANVSYDPSDPVDTARLIQAVDTWYDEQGFNGDASPVYLSDRLAEPATGFTACTGNARSPSSTT